MASTTETGHAKNVATFEDLISFCTGYGATYNPSKNSIKLAALNSLLTSSRAAIATVNSAATTFNNTVNARVIAFEPIKKLATKLLNALDATDAKKQTVADAKTIIRKLQGRRAEPIPFPTTPTDPNAPAPAAKVISASQLSFDSQIENLSRLITLLQSEPLYIPNENELKLVTLNTLLASLRIINTNVINATTPLSNARIARDKTLYAADTGLHDIAMEVKKYVKSVFGATSPEYKQISKLKFTKIKR